MSFPDLWARLRTRFLALPPKTRLILCGVAGAGAVWWVLTPGLDSRLLKLERAHYPNGRRFVIGHNNVTDFSGCLHGSIHYPGVDGWREPFSNPYEVDWFPDSGLTAAAGHAFVFSAWPQGQAVPELEQSLVESGILSRTSVPITRDTRDEAGHRVIRHETMTFFLAKAWDPRLAFCTNYAVGGYRPPLSSGGIERNGKYIPSRLSDQPIPEDPKVAVPRQAQWATSQVSGFVVTDTPVRVDNAVRRVREDGEVFYTATVYMRREIPKWMQTPVFRSAYHGSAAIDPDRLHPVETAFHTVDGKLQWVDERPRMTPGDPE